MTAVSVIIPTFNRAHLICETIESVLSQTFHDFEIIVVDDGSTDGTEELLRNTFGDRIRYVRQDNAGPAVARNRGIFASQGEYIALNDSDDLWYPDKLEKQFAILKSRPEVGFIFSDCIRGPAIIHPKPRGGYYADVEFTAGDLFPFLLHCNPVPTSSVLFRRDLIATAGLFDATLRWSEDYDFWLRLSRVTQSYRLPEVSMLLREHLGRVSHVVDGMIHSCRANELQAIRWEFLGEPTLSKLRKRVFNAFAGWSYAERARGNYRRAYFALRKAMAYADQPWRSWPRALILRWCSRIFSIWDWIRGRKHHN